MTRRLQLSVTWLLWLMAVVAFWALTAAKRSSVEPLEASERITVLVMAAILVIAGFVLLRRP